MDIEKYKKLRYGNIDAEETKVREALPDYERLYTVEDYLSWDESFKAELYEGALVVAFSPTHRHQGISGEIYGQIWQFLKGKQCKAFPAPFSVKLFENEETVFVPDIVVICDESKLGGHIFNGAPDMVIEILSPSTARLDKKLKYQKYQKAGVKEYWIVDPELNLLEANVMNSERYTTMIYDENDKAPVHILDGFEINLADVFKSQWKDH